jgi:hypothetical protein
MEIRRILSYWNFLDLASKQNPCFLSMHMHRKILTRVLILILVFLSCFSSALADRPAAQKHYKKLSGNGRYVFVMLSPRRHEVFENYEMSGLYINDGSEAPLWKIHWYAFLAEVASDGKHLVRLGRSASYDDQEAVSFFANGYLIRTYKIKELVSFPFLLPHSVSHFRWRAGEKLYDEKLLFSITTLLGDHYVFDITTGEIISSFRSSLWVAIIFFVMLMLSIFISQKLFLLILAISSFFLVLISQGIIFPIGIFLGLWICGNILSMLNKLTSQLFQKWKKMMISIGKGKLLAIFVFLIPIVLLVLLAGPAMVKTKIRLYMPKSKSLAEQPPKSSEDYLSVTIAKDGNYTAYYYGVVADGNTDLEWITGPKSLSWGEAKTWAENLNVGGGGWHLPTLHELQTLYQDGKERTKERETPVLHLLKATGMFAWSSSSAEEIFIPTGPRESIGMDMDNVMVFAVRSRTNR